MARLKFRSKGQAAWPCLKMLETLVKLVTKVEASSLLEVTYISTHQAERESRERA